MSLSFWTVAFFFLLQWLPVGNVRVTPEALFSFSLFCSPVLSLLSDPLPPSPVSAFTCLPVIWPVRMGGDSDALWSPWSSVATWRHLISLDIPVLAVALYGFQPAQKPHWVMSYVPGSLTSYNLAFFRLPLRLKSSIEQTHFYFSLVSVIERFRTYYYRFSPPCWC